MRSNLKLIVFGVLALMSFKAVPNPNEEWALFKEINGVKFYKKTNDCQLKMGFDERRVLLKIENTTNVNKALDWDIWLWYDNVCKTCDIQSGEYHRTIMLPAFSSMEGECEVETNFDLVIFVKFIDSGYRGAETVLTNFELHDLTVVDSE